MTAVAIDAPQLPAQHLRGKAALDFLAKHLRSLDTKGIEQRAEAFLDTHLAKATTTAARSRTVADIIDKADKLVEDHRRNRDLAAVTLVQRFRVYGAQKNYIIPASGLQKVRLTELVRDVDENGLASGEQARMGALDDVAVCRMLVHEAEEVQRGETLGRLARAARAQIIVDLKAQGTATTDVQDKLAVQRSTLGRVLKRAGQHGEGTGQ